MPQNPPVSSRRELLQRRGLDDWVGARDDAVRLRETTHGVPGDFVMRPGWTFTVLITTVPMVAASARAWDRLALDNVPAPAPLVAEEPLARSFSLESAARSLDVGALHWQKTRKCAAVIRH